MIENNCIERRQHENLSTKSQLKLNVDRYVASLKFSHLVESEEIFRKTDYIFNVIGITLNTAAFLNTIELLGSEDQASKWR